MNYIYDVVLNLQKEYYDFYEWNQNDNIFHMRKIPIIKINKKQLLEIKNHLIKFNGETLKYFNTKIYAERFKENNITKIKSILILSAENFALAIKFNKNGIITYKSSLLPEEQDDILEISKFQKEIVLDYKIIQKNKTEFKTRFELENEKFIRNELDTIYKEQNTKKLNYIYLECFNKNEKNYEIAYKELKKEIYKANNNFKKIYNIFKITKQK